MKVSLVTLGTRGDVQPYIALGKALAARGHEVRLAAPGNFACWVEGHGLEFFPIGVDMEALLKSPEVRRIVAGNLFATLRIWRKSIAPMIRASLDATWQAARDAELIVFHPKAGGAVDVAELTGAALVCAVSVPLFATGAFPFLAFEGDYGPWLNRQSYKLLSLSRLPMLGLLNRWRRETLGLGRSPAFLSVEGYGDARATCLCAVSPSVVPGLEDPPRRLYATGTWFLDEGGDWRPDPALAAFLAAGEPPVYIGFGSMTTRDPVGLARTVFEAVRRAGVRAVVATGWGGLAEIDPPEGVHLIDAAPHDSLFAHVCAVVHHGGSGTTAEGLRAGLPTLVCPLAFDQPFWGRRVHALGCGPEPQPLRRLKAKPLARALAALIRRDAYRRRAREVARAIAAEDGLGRAVAIIEAAARRRDRLAAAG